MQQERQVRGADAVTQVKALPGQGRGGDEWQGQGEKGFVRLDVCVEGAMQNLWVWRNPRCCVTAAPA